MQVRCFQIKPQGNQIRQYVVFQYTKESRSYKNLQTCKKISLQLDYTVWLLIKGKFGMGG